MKQDPLLNEKDDDYIVFDVETTGLPITPAFCQYFSPENYDEYYSSSRIVQVALVSKRIYRSWIIKPNDFKIENSQFHGITQERAVEEGVSWDEMMEEFFTLIDKFEYIVGHNIQFDIHVFAAELYRRGYGRKATQLLNKPFDDTMLLGREKMQQYRMPKLTNLYEFLFKKQFDNPHNALYDCKATKECYEILTRT